MPIESVKLEELNAGREISHKAVEQKCIFYKDSTCTPNKIQFNICSRCHRCKVITPENLLPQMFGRIIGLANLLMGIMGMGLSGGSGSGGAAGAGGGGGGGGGGS